MKIRIRNLIAFVIMATAIAVSLIQLRIPVVRAAGCPSASEIGCQCMFTGEQYLGGGVTACNYLCGSCSGGDEPMYIEQTIYVYD
jgi:hypothetical protein